MGKSSMSKLMSIYVYHFRALMSARSSCLKHGQCDAHDIDFRHFDRLLLKLGEHTWGTLSFMY